MNYEELSDFEINKLVAEALAWEKPNCKNVTFENNCFWVEHIGFSSFSIENYCNSPDAAWPIILKNKINLVAPNAGSQWRVFINITNGCKVTSDHHTFNKKPLRAAMISYLKLNGNNTCNP